MQLQVAITVTASPYPITVVGGGGLQAPGSVSPSQVVSGIIQLFSTITSAGGGGGGGGPGNPSPNQGIGTAGGSGGGGGAGPQVLLEELLEQEIHLQQLPLKESMVELG